MGAVTRSVLVRGDFADIAKVATDPDVVFPIIGGFGRFEYIEKDGNGPEEWDVYIDVGTIHVGGRVVVEQSSERVLIWHSLRGTHHHARIEVSKAEDGAKVSMMIAVELAGSLLTGWVTTVLAEGILGRHMEAGLQQLRHRIEYGD
jgi:hypothetical protein